MITRYEPLRDPFSTADAEYPLVTSERGCLRVMFRDWQEKIVTLLFHDVAAFSWDDGEAAIDANHRDDCSYIVHGSPWLARHNEVGTLMSSEETRHYKLCFNASGVLQVLASRLEILAEP
ncbi:MAG: hypothetical protein KF688_12035 [Pirellulales bacterium]|nr:hypothetical protein [Pirellulales bacterium]